MKRREPHQARKATTDQGFLRKLVWGILPSNWYKPDFHEGERLESVHDIGILGLYRIITTNKRLIVVKQFPKNLIETEYTNIEFAEYYTNVSWLSGIYALGIAAISVLFFLNHATIMDKLFTSLPFLEPLLGGRFIWGLSHGAAFILAAMDIWSLFYAGRFGSSLFGSLRILLYGQPPIDIKTKMTKELQQVIQKVEARNPPRSQRTIIKNVYKVHNPLIRGSRARTRASPQKRRVV